MAGIHADQADDNNFQSGGATREPQTGLPMDTSYAFRTWYARNKHKISDLTRVSEANTGMMRAIEAAFEAGMDYERDYISNLEDNASSVTRIVNSEGQLIRTITAHRAG